MKCKQLALRVLSTAAILSIVSSIAAPVFAETYYIGNGYDLSIEAKEDGKVYVNGHEDQDGEITIKGSAGKDSLTEEKKEQETGENSGAEKQTVTEETPKEKTSAEEGETKKQDTPSENSDEENEGKDPANENKKDDAPAAEENDPQPEDTAEPEEKAVKKEAADSGENAPAALQSTAAAKSAPEKNTSVEKSPVSNVIKIVNNWADKILKITLDNVNIKADKAAMSISGSGNVTLELEGKNELTGGSTSSGKGNGIRVEEGYNQYGGSFSGGKLTIQGKEGSSLSATGGSDTKNGGDGIRAYELELVDATVTATGGAGGGNGVYSSNSYGTSNFKNSKLTARGGDQLTPDGAGNGIFSDGKVIVGEGSEVIAIGGSNKTVNKDIYGGTALDFWGMGSGYEVQKGGKLTAIGGNAESESGDATGGNAIWGEYGGIVSAGETTLIGGNAKSGSGEAVAGDGINGDSCYFPEVTVKDGTFTALGGKAENASNTATNGNSIYISPYGNEERTELKVEKGGTFITAKPDGSDENGNGITGTIKINTNGGKIEEVENAKVVKKDDGTVEVVGNVVGMVTGNHKYKLTATVQPTCTTPGKRVYTCTTHEGETYEETIDALGHEFVNGVCTRCGAPESNGGSSAVTLTVTGAGAYETSIADGRYVVAVPAETAVLSGCLSNLKELKAQGVNTLVFRTQLRETALNIDSMLSLGVDDTLFTLTHNGEGASLTIGGFEHNELIH